MKKYIELNNEAAQQVDGFYQLEKDLEAVAEFEKEIAERMYPFKGSYERITWLIANDYYYDALKWYTMKNILKLEVYVKEFGFKFKSFMAIQKFYNEYALKTNDGDQFLETYEDRIVITSLFLGQGDTDKAKMYADQMIKQNYQPATPTMLNAGKARRGEMVSCFLLSMDDSLNSINHVLSMCKQLSKIGGGVAVDVSKLRARGEEIKGIANAASGVLPVLKLLEDSFAYANQLGQRKGAGAAYINIFHSDIIEFLDTKKINADEKTRIQSLSLGLIVPNKLLELAKEDKPFVVFKPYTVFKAYGVHLADMDMNEMYEELLANDAVEKVDTGLTAREFYNKISLIEIQSGYPYMMYIDNANKVHALKDIGQIKMSNLCTEIFQLQETSIINDYGVGDVIKRDISCNLGSLNIVNVMESKELEEAVIAGMYALTAVSDMTDITNAPSVAKANEELHSVGLGAMNLHGFFLKNKIAYESEIAKEFARVFFAAMNFYSIKASMQIAKERKVVFKGFGQSEYNKGTYFKKYIDKSYRPVSDKVKALFEGIKIPTQAEWKQLSLEVRKYGMYHAYRMAIAPTGSISYVQNSTQSIMPITQEVEARTTHKATTYYPMPFLSKENYVYYMKTAYVMDQEKVIDLIAEIQEHVDQGISTTLHITSDTSTKQVVRYLAYAQHKGLKSIYYTRLRDDKKEICAACVV